MTSGLVAQMSSAGEGGTEWGWGWEPALELEQELPPERVLVLPSALDLAPEQVPMLALEWVLPLEPVWPSSRSCCPLLPMACHQPSSPRPQRMPTQAAEILECEDLECPAPDD